MVEFTVCSSGLGFQHKTAIAHPSLTRTRTTTHTHTHTRTHTHTHTHTHARARTHTHAHARTRTRTHAHARTHTHARVHTRARSHKQGNYQCAGANTGMWDMERLVKGNVDALVSYGFDSVKCDSGFDNCRNMSLWADLLNASGRPVMIENCHQGGGCHSPSL
jgi:hypothetical protein